MLQPDSRKADQRHWPTGSEFTGNCGAEACYAFRQSRVARVVLQFE
jgi:hypothetical protein